MKDFELPPPSYIRRIEARYYKDDMREVPYWDSVAVRSAIEAYKQHLLQGVGEPTVFAEFRLDEHCGHVDLLPFDTPLEVEDGMKLVPLKQVSDQLAAARLQGRMEMKEEAVKRLIDTGNDHCADNVRAIKD